MKNRDEDEIDLFAPITTSTIDNEEQEKARQMIRDLYNFSSSDIGEHVMSSWELNFIDSLSAENSEKVLTEKQLENIDRIHTKYLVNEDFSR